MALLFWHSYSPTMWYLSLLLLFPSVFSSDTCLDQTNITTSTDEVVFFESPDFPMKLVICSMQIAVNDTENLFVSFFEIAPSLHFQGEFSNLSS